MGYLLGSRYKNKFEFQMSPVNFEIDKQVFIGLVSFYDPLKKGIKASFQKLRAANIKTVMITGDQQISAVAIAKKTGIISEESLPDSCLLCPEEGKPKHAIIDGSYLLETMKQEIGLPEKQKYAPIKKALEKDEVIVCRADPTQKLLIVRLLQNMGHVVAVTGDGVNDSPAVKFADVGISMGTGSDATRDSADIIITDDDLNSLLIGVEEGRKLYDNLKKAICYVVTGQVSEFMPFIALIFLRIPIPVFTLLIDSAADFIPAITYAWEEGEEGIMTRMPRFRDDHLVNSRLLGQCVGWMGISSFFCSMAAYYFCMLDFGFPPGSLWGKSNIGILVPGLDDHYNPTDPHFGNSHLAEFSTCAQFRAASDITDWINSTHPEADLRMSALICHEQAGRLVFEQNMRFGECRLQQLSVSTGRPICYSTEATKYAQTAYMYANVINQMFNFFICKTRKQSVFQTKLTKPLIYFGLTVEVLLAIALSETLFLTDLIGTRDTTYLHYGVTAIPFGMLQLTLDEAKKFLIRNLPGSGEGTDSKPNWMERNILW